MVTALPRRSSVRSSRCVTRSDRRPRPRARRALSWPRSAATSRRSGVAASAAADGVGARWSATRSHKVLSVSCPTAEITGTGTAATARATRSELKLHRSSGERAADGVFRAVALHLGGDDEQLEERPAAARHGDDVAHRRAVFARYDRQARRVEGQRALARRIEQAVLLERSLRLLEGELPQPTPLGREQLDHGEAKLPFF